jgi:hypothetical protein
MYKVYIQRTRNAKFCVCLVSEKNGKLILKGEPINKLADASETGQAIIWNMNCPPYAIEILPWTHRWPKNAGPKKRA